MKRFRFRWSELEEQDIAKIWILFFIGKNFELTSIKQIALLSNQGSATTITIALLMNFYNTFSFTA